jgi:hypothetical protein
MSLIISLQLSSLQKSLSGLCLEEKKGINLCCPDRTKIVVRVTHEPEDS